MAQIYWAYCSKVRIDTQILNQIEEILLNLRNSGSFNLLTQNCDDSCGIICISGGTKSLGKIDNGNKAISRLIGYELAELKELPVTSIMPSIFRESHHKLFQSECYLTEAGQRKEYSERESFILHKSQYIIPVDIKITEIPNVLNSYCFIAKVKLNQEKNKYNIIHIIASPNGIIKNISASIFVLTIDSIIQLDLNLELINEEDISKYTAKKYWYISLNCRMHF